MNRVRLLALVVVIGACLCGKSFSQSISDTTARVMTLQDAINFALERSFNVKSLRLNLESTRQNLVARKGSFKTNANLQFDSPNRSEQFVPITDPNGLSTYQSLGSLRFAGRLNINQPLPTNGLFTLASRLYREDLSTYLFNNPDPLKRRDFYTSIGLQFNQPLFTINTLKLGFEEANLNYERASGQIRRTELDVIYLVTQAFHNLYGATRTLEIAREEMKQQEEAYNLASKKFAAGLIPEVEALQTEVDLAQSRNRLLSAESALHRQQDILKQTIGMPLSENVVVQTRVEFKSFSIDLAKALEFGLANRSEIRERAIERRLQEIEMKRIDARSEFKAELSLPTILPV